jgi:hypothetical protein
MAAKRMWIGVLSALLGLAFCSQGAENQGGNRLAKVEERAKKAEERIDHRIAAVKERLAKNPDAPEAVKSAADKLVADLTTKKGDVEKLLADAEAHNKSGVKTDRETLKNDRQTIKADHEALRNAVHAGKGAHPRHQDDGKHAAA